MKKEEFLEAITTIRKSSYSPENPQLIIFEVEYLHLAWKIHTGFFINKFGEVYTYDYNYQSDPWKPNAENLYYEDELLNKYDHRKRLLRHIDHRVVAIKQELIKKIPEDFIPVEDNDPHSEKLNFICYSYNRKKKQYKEIILCREGVQTMRIDSPAAESLIRWLKSISNFAGERSGSI
jgi:hypothetical protein